MKLISFSLIVVCMILLGSCSSSSSTKEPEYVPVNLPKEQEPKVAGYYCPMKCEGEKVYENDGKPCPVCDMKLIHTK